MQNRRGSVEFITVLLIPILLIFLGFFVEKGLREGFTPLIIAASLATLLLSIGALFFATALRSGGSPELASSRPRRVLYWIFVLIAGVIVTIAALSVFNTDRISKPSTIYFIVDATEKMRPLFEEGLAHVQIGSSFLEDDTNIGVRIYGGTTDKPDICQESRQLVELGPYSEQKQKLDTALSGVNPGGHSSLTDATLEAMLTDLDQASEPIKLVLITSGIDKFCDAPAGSPLKARAEDVGQDVKLIIVSVGTPSPDEILLFKGYADAFGGEYHNTSNLETLTTFIEGVSAYGYGYGK